MELPPSFYYAVGVVVVANVGGIIKLVWHLAKSDSETKEAKSMAVRAHKRIDRLEEK